MRTIVDWSCTLALLLGMAWALPLSAAENNSAVRTVYLIRHGAYLPDPNADREAGPALTPLGIAQARLVATRFRSMPIAFDTIVSSTLTRAQQTAAIVHEQIGDAAASASPLISECTPPTSAAGQGENATMQSACKTKLDAAFTKFFVPAKGADKHDVLVCHGNVIRYLTTKALGVDTRAWTGMSVAHASVTIIQVYPNGALNIIAIGDSGHVPANMQSWGDDADPHLVVPELGRFATPR